MQKTTVSSRDLSPVLSYLLSPIAWLVFSFFTLFIFLSGVFIGLPQSLLFDRAGTRRASHTSSRLWGKGIIAACPLWSIGVEGQENLKPGQHYVVVANHQSLLDILVVLAGLPLHFKFMAKKELFSIPVMGWHMTVAGYIPIDRGKKESAREAVASARAWIHKGVSLLFFPEGTRSPDGEIQLFKSGAFKVAAQENVPLLPVIVDGTGDALPKHSWLFKKKSRFLLRICKPVTASSQEPEAIETLKESIRLSMIEELRTLRAASSRQDR